MQKVYLLLRNNQQMGPYTFEELLALHLKPFDLVWIEGKSHGWRYPAEVEALKQYVAPDPSGLQQPVERSEAPHEKPESSIIPRPSNPSPKNVFVSMPFTSARQNVAKNIDPIEQKAEELRKRAEAYAPSEESIKTNYARDLQHAEEEYTQWVYQSKTKKKTVLNKRTLVISAIGILVLSVGWWATSKLTDSSPVQVPAVVQQKEKLPASISEPEADAQTGSEPVQNFVAVNLSAEKEKKEENKKQGDKNIITTENKKQIASATKTTTEENIPVEAVEKNTTAPTASEEEGAIVSAPIEKKKTLKEKLNGLFKNKKTEGPEATSESGAAQSKDGERIATRRNEEKELATSIADVSDQVEIKTNKIADSWMMGVKNLKLTLVNRSSLTISSAKIDVLYYSDQNNLLEKKTISFANIAPGKSQSVPAPDHRLADHIEHKVVFAKGFDNAYARQ